MSFLLVPPLGLPDSRGLYFLERKEKKSRPSYCASNWIHDASLKIGRNKKSHNLFTGRKKKDIPNTKK